MTAPAKNAARPLSPHVFIYRWPLAAWISIGHRLTGLALIVGLTMIAWWVIAAAYGPGALNVVGSFVTSWIGKLIMFGFSFALFLHLCNGIRHLFWDAGMGFEKARTATTNVVVVMTAVGLTIISWLVAYM